MVIAAIILAVFSTALLSAILLKRRYNTLIGVVGGLATGVSCWAIASFGMFVWFVNS